MRSTGCYDAIIVGAGIGGLTCGNYMAKAGMRVLILERHVVAGGYASSFRKKGFYFDAAAHYLSSCRERGQLGRLIADHRLDTYFSIQRFNPSDTILLPNHTIELSTEFPVLIETFQRHFPREASNIQNFFQYIANTDAASLYVQLKDKTFSDLMDAYLTNDQLKAVLELLLANIGSSARRASALSSVFLFREYIFDGGYYPKGGMQQFCDALVKRFQDYGGTIAFGTPAKAIRVNNGHVAGVEVKTGEIIYAPRVISNCNPFQTFYHLLKEQEMNGKFHEYLKLLQRGIPSISAFMLHIGTTRSLRDRIDHQGCIWYCPSYDLQSRYNQWMDGIVDFSDDDFVFASSPSIHDSDLAPPGRDSLQLIIGTAYKDKEFWKQNKERLADAVTKRAERFIADLSDIIDFRLIATPLTLEKYTLNHAGAMYGWAPLPTQIGQGRLPSATPVEGLYLVGHWSGPPAGTGGIPMAVFSGRYVANRILRINKSSHISSLSELNNE